MWWLAARQARPGGRGAALGLIVIVLLLAAWAVVLVPSIGFRRFGSNPINGVRSFEQLMGTLASTRGGRPPGRYIMVPGEPGSGPRRRRNRVIRRRRQAFARLLASAGATLVLSVIPGLHALFMAHLACDAALLLYVAQLRRWRRADAQRAQVVRRLPVEQPAITDDLVATNLG